MCLFTVAPAAFKNIYAQTILHHTKFLRQNAMAARIVSIVDKFYWPRLGVLVTVMRVPAGVGVCLSVCAVISTLLYIKL